MTISIYFCEKVLKFSSVQWMGQSESYVGTLYYKPFHGDLEFSREIFCGHSGFRMSLYELAIICLRINIPIKIHRWLSFQTHHRCPQYVVHLDWHVNTGRRLVSEEAFLQSAQVLFLFKNWSRFPLLIIKDIYWMKLS